MEFTLIKKVCCGLRTYAFQYSSYFLKRKIAWKGVIKTAFVVHPNKQLFPRVIVLLGHIHLIQQFDKAKGKSHERKVRRVLLTK